MKGLEALLNPDEHMNEDARIVYAEQFQTELALLQHRQRQPATNAVSAYYCETCDNPIPEARRVAVPGVTLCVDCKNVEDHYERKYG